VNVWVFRINVLEMLVDLRKMQRFGERILRYLGTIGRLEDWKVGRMYELATSSTLPGK